MIHISMNRKFCVLRYTRSHVIPDIVYVPMNLSSLFCVPRDTRSHATLHMLLT